MSLEITVDPSSTVPPYEQLRSQVAAAVASGDLPSGTKLATVRQMAADLGLAPNTVARAYRELEADGVIVTQGRRGTFVRSTLLGTAETPARDVAEDYVRTARRLGLTLAEAVRLIEDGWAR